jgi:hypothetical protein
MKSNTKNNFFPGKLNKNDSRVGTDSDLSNNKLKNNIPISNKIVRNDSYKVRLNEP